MRVIIIPIACGGNLLRLRFAHQRVPNHAAVHAAGFRWLLGVTESLRHTSYALYTFTQASLCNAIPESGSDLVGRSVRVWVWLASFQLIK